MQKAIVIIAAIAGVGVMIFNRPLRVILNE
jgi:hypothetical protein